jgi:Na+/melibiose symporter-like transporter
MYAAALPLGISVYLLFTPPEFPPDLPREPLLLAWLLVFIVAARVCMTFFIIPWSAMFAEYSDDYRERSAIVAYRFLMAMIGGIAFSLSVYTWVFPSTAEYPLGQLNPEAYGTLAWVLAVCVVAAVLMTAHFTRDQIPYLMQPVGPKQRFQLAQLVADARMALRNRDFLILLAAVLSSAVVIGTTQALEIYVRTYFWGLDTGSLRWLTLAFAGALLAFATVGPLQNRFDKKHLLVGCAIILMVQGMALIGLRLIDVLPPNGDPLLLPLLVADAVFSVYFAIIALVMFTSMIADTLDLQELDTGLRQEGLFSSAVGFSSKATSGFGLLIAGALLDGVIGFPAQAGAGGVPVGEDVVLRLGVVAGLVVPLANVVWMLLALRYGITRESHAEVRRQLDERHAHFN